MPGARRARRAPARGVARARNRAGGLVGGRDRHDVAPDAAGRRVPLARRRAVAGLLSVRLRRAGPAAARPRARPAPDPVARRHRGRARARRGRRRARLPGARRGQRGRRRERPRRPRLPGRRPGARGLRPVGERADRLAPWAGARTRRGRAAARGVHRHVVAVVRRRRRSAHRDLRLAVARVRRAARPGRLAARRRSAADRALWPAPAPAARRLRRRLAGPCALQPLARGRHRRLRAGQRHARRGDRPHGGHVRRERPHPLRQPPRGAHGPADRPGQPAGGCSTTCRPCSTAAGRTP